MTPAEARTALRAVTELSKNATEPGSYAHVIDDLARIVAETPAEVSGVRYGDRVRLRCSATGLYLANGVGLYVSAMCNDLGIDRVAPGVEPWADSPVPSPDALAGASTAYSHLLPAAW